MKFYKQISRLRENAVSEQHLEESEVANQVWKAYQELRVQHKERREHVFKMRLEHAEAHRMELIRHESCQPDVDVTEVAARTARVLAQSTANLVDMVAKAVTLEKDENENSQTSTVLGVLLIKLQTSGSCQRSWLRSGKSGTGEGSVDATS